MDIIHKITEESSMKSSKMTQLLSFFLCGVMLLSFFACENGENDTTHAQNNETTDIFDTSPEETTFGETEASELTSTEEDTTMNESVSTQTPIEETTEEVTTPVIELGSYSNGKGIKEAGDKIKKSDFALQTNEIDDSSAVLVSADELLALLSKKDGAVAGEVYRVTEKLTLSSDTVYYGNLAAVIAEGGIEISNASGIVIRELVIVGYVTIQSSTDIELFKVDIREGEFGIVADMGSSNISIKSSIISAEKTAIYSEADVLSVYSCRIKADRGIIADGDDSAIQSCIIEAGSLGISSSGRYLIAKNNTLTADSDGVGIDMRKGSYNGLAALNVINDVQRSVLVEGAYNCVIILNRAIYIGGSSSKNLYVIKNRLGGAIELSDNEYLICDGNLFSEDGKSHPTVSLRNAEINGSNITDLNSRAEYGVNEALLPHSDPEQFVGMERRASVNDISVTKGYRTYYNYVRYCAETGSVVIIPPGAYALSSKLDLEAKHSNTDIYAYGVYNEANFLRTVLDINYCKELDILGLTVGYAFPNAGQVQIVKKLGGRQALCVVTAGFDEGFGATNTAKYSTTLVDSFRHDGTHPYISVGNNQSATDNGDGTYTLTFKSLAQYNLTEVGDVIVCRLSTRGSNTVFVGDAESVSFTDLTVYGYTAAAAVRFMRSRDVSLERYHSTAPAPYIIDKETYDRYKAMEEQYGVDLEVYIDAEGRYRGSRPRSGSGGSMEVADSYEGVSLTSSHIEHICDDGSNQRGTASRVAGIEKNSDGTYTVYFKGCHTYIYHSEISNPTAGYTSWEVLGCAPVEKGDKLLGYASNGAVLFDNAEALEDAKPLTGSTAHWAHIDSNSDGICDVCGKATNAHGNEYPEKNTQYDPNTGRITYSIRRMFGTDYLALSTTLYSVRVKADGVNMSALDGYDLVTNDYLSSTHVFFNNLSKACANFTFDNVLIEDHRSRGVLIKTRNVTIKHSTFRNLQCQALIIGSENVWGESSVPSNIKIESCVFDNASYSLGEFKNIEFATINIQGLGEINNNITLSEHFACNNISITHNKFVNTFNENVIHASGVRYLTVEDNIFETRPDNGKVIYINGCLDVSINSNTYINSDPSKPENVITAYKYKDLTFEGAKLPDSNENPVK